MKSFKILFIAALIQISFIGFAQQYQFAQFSLEEGLSHPFVYTINEDINGFVWFGTGEGLCRFDGFVFEKCANDDSLTDGYVTCSYRDDQKNLWFGHNSGELTKYYGKSFEKIDIEELVGGTITTIDGDGKGNVILGTQNKGLLRISPENKVDTFRLAFKNKLLNSFVFTKADYYTSGIC